VPGLALAGAWTSTGWPDTMEGAVRSGHEAAQQLIRELAAQPWANRAEEPGQRDKTADRPDNAWSGAS
jgi:uncharacterized protein with NAD-binding domain and iron-sulfur cluster